VRGVVSALFTGKLRERFYSDIIHLGDAADAPRQAATAYMCLAASVGWWLSMVGTLALNPTYVTAHVLGFINGLANLLGFLRLRARKDPRDVLDILLLMSLGSIAVIAMGHAGVLAPVALSMPTIAGVSARYQRPRMRRVTLVAGIAVTALCMAVALDFVGSPTTYSPRAYVLAVFFVLTGSTLSLGGLAWISVLARDYLLGQVQASNNAIVDSAARARLALEAARVGLWEVPDVEKRRFHVSESFQAVTGYTGEEFSAVFGNLE
jgi:PAS domain-containing protein